MKTVVPDIPITTFSYRPNLSWSPNFSGKVKRLHRIVTADEMLFVIMPERGTIDAVFILRKLQE